MARITLFAEGISLAHVTRPLLVAKQLLSRGHEVCFFTGEKYVAWARDRGIQAQPIWTPDPAEVYGRLRKLKPMLTEQEVAQAVSADLDVIGQTRPGVVVGDCRNSLRISSALAGVPYAALTNANCTPWYSGPIVIPPRAVGSERVARGLMRWLPDRVLAMMHDVGCRQFAKPFDRVARRLGAEVDCTDFRMVFTSDDLTLLADEPRFNPTQALPCHAAYIGPLDWPSDASVAEPTRECLDRVEGSKLLVVALGSTGDEATARHLRAAIDGGGWSVVVVGVAHPRQRPNADQWFELPFADMPTLLDAATAVVCHGGNGTVYQALRAGKPVLACPTFFDQQTQAVLLERMNAGRWLAGYELRNKRTLQAYLHEAADVMRVSFEVDREIDTAQAAAEQIEGLINTGSDVAGSIAA